MKATSRTTMMLTVAAFALASAPPDLLTDLREQEPRWYKGNQKSLRRRRRRVRSGLNTRRL
jgi:hypothetical protein